jgi:membrane dipeptidase
MQSSLDQARSLHQRAVVVDTHHDIVLDVVERRRRGEKGVLSQYWGKKLQTGGVNVQLLPLFVENTYLPELGLRRILQAVDAVLSDLADDDGVMCLATSMADVDRALADGKIAGVLAMEGCAGLSGDPAMLRILYRLGVRMVSFTWNRRNEFADGTQSMANPGGLSEAGKVALIEMYQHNVICDVSHLAEPGFWDVARLCPGPFVASHSNARAVLDHPRNLTDDQLRAIAGSGGVVGLNFYGDYVDALHPTLDKLIDHLSHIVDTIGIEHVGIGPDFLEDSLRESSREALVSAGYDASIAEHWMPDCDRTEHLPAFTAKLLDRGFAPQEIHMILGANFMRVFRQVWD